MPSSGVSKRSFSPPSRRGDAGPYKDLLNYLRGVSRQEFLLYLLESVPSKGTDARNLLNTYVRAELGERSVKSPDELDYGRYAEWATGMVRKPAGKPAEELATAVRVVGLLKLESERKYLTELASDANSGLREAVAQALGRLKGEKGTGRARSKRGSVPENAPTGPRPHPRRPRQDRRRGQLLHQTGPPLIQPRGDAHARRIPRRSPHRRWRRPSVLQYAQSACPVWGPRLDSCQTECRGLT